MSEFLTVARVASALCISRKRVYQLISDGKLDSMRPCGRNIRISRESLERFIRQGIAKEKQERGLDIERPKAPNAPTRP